MKICSSCGATYTDRVDFCFEDGGVLAIGAAEAASQGAALRAQTPRPDPIDTLPPTESPVLAPDAPPPEAQDAPNEPDASPWLEPPPPVDTVVGHALAERPPVEPGSSAEYGDRPTLVPDPSGGADPFVQARDAAIGGPVALTPLVTPLPPIDPPTPMPRVPETRSLPDSLPRTSPPVAAQRSPSPPEGAPAAAAAEAPPPRAKGKARSEGQPRGGEDEEEGTDASGWLVPVLAFGAVVLTVAGGVLFVGVASVGGMAVLDGGDSPVQAKAHVDHEAAASHAVAASSPVPAPAAEEAVEQEAVAGAAAEPSDPVADPEPPEASAATSTGSATPERRPASEPRRPAASATGSADPSRPAATAAPSEFREPAKAPPSEGTSAAPAPTIGPVSFDSNPSGATVSVDGTRQGTTPLTLDLSIGDHVVEVEKSGWVKARRSIKVEASGTQLAVDLVPETKKGTVIVAAKNADGRTLRVDGVDVGLLPVTLDLTEGPHVFQVEGPDGPYQVTREVVFNDVGRAFINL